jgi:uncharacterized protein involved in exopolysaccharide biosynthesis
MADEQTPMIQAPEEDEIDLLDLVKVVAKRWKFIFGFTAGAAVIVVVLSVYTRVMPAESPWNPLPNVYSPEVKIRLEESQSGDISSLLNSSGLSSLAGLLGASLSKQSTNADLAEDILKGNTLVDRITREFDFAGRYKYEKFPLTSARKAFMSAVKVERDTGSGIITIKYTDIDKEFATRVVNRVVDLLEERFKGFTLQRISVKKAFLEESLAQARSDLDNAKDTVILFQTKNGIIDIPTQAEAMITQITVINTKITDKELELYSLRQYRQENDPQIQIMKNEIAALRKLMDETQRGFSEFSSAFAPANKLPELSATYLALTRELTVQETIYTALRAQYESTKIEELDNSRLFQIIERAEVPEIKSGPSRGKISVIVTVSVFFLSVFITFVLEYLEKARQNPEQAEKLREIRGYFRLSSRKMG